MTSRILDKYGTGSLSVVVERAVRLLLQWHIIPIRRRKVGSAIWILEFSPGRRITGRYLFQAAFPACCCCLENVD